MMGRQANGQDRLFYSFNLEDHVPQSHLLRGIDRCLDFGGLREHLAEHYSPIGRPSIDPELMLRMLIVGYCYGIRSERRLCEELHLNLAYRWFCRLGLEDPVPDHSTFSRNRHGRFRDSGVFRWLFDEVVRRCMAAGLVKAEGFAVDASIVAADASSQRGVPGTEPVDWKDPALSTRAVREYLQGLDSEALGKVLPKKISLTDPQASWTAAVGGPAFYAYSTNYLIDVAHGVILDVQATPAHRTAETESTKVMVERVQAQFELKPQRLIGDTAYGTAAMLSWMVDEQGVAARARVGSNAARRRNVLQQRVHLGRASQRIHLPARPSAAQPVAGLQDRAQPRHQGRHHHLQRQEARLLELSHEAALLPQHPGAQDRAQCSRSCARRGAQDRHHRAVRALALRAQESGNAVRPSEANPATGSTAPARAQRSERRVHDGGGGAEPASSGGPGAARPAAPRH